jgi:hypothetical protein
MAPDKSLERTREGQSAKFTRRRARRSARTLGRSRDHIFSLCSSRTIGPIGGGRSAALSQAPRSGKQPLSAGLCRRVSREHRLKHLESADNSSGSKRQWWTNGVARALQRSHRSCGIGSDRLLARSTRFGLGHLPAAAA